MPVQGVAPFLKSAYRPVNKVSRPLLKTDRPTGNQRHDEKTHVDVVVLSRQKPRRPGMYKVLMLNDDYTPMEFVIHVLERYFLKSRDEATRIMLSVHRAGIGLCGVYTLEVAEDKVMKVMDLARQNQHPLQCSIEKA